jgi:hypothetical protein
VPRRVAAKVPFVHHFVCRATEPLRYRTAKLGRRELSGSTQGTMKSCRSASAPSDGRLNTMIYIHGVSSLISIDQNQSVINPLRSQLQISTESVRKLHLARCATFGFKNLWRTYEDCNALCPGSGDVQSVEAVQELHTSRCVRV